MLKKCLHGFFQGDTEIHEPLFEIHEPLFETHESLTYNNRVEYILDESPPLSSYLPGELAPLPLRRIMRTKNKQGKRGVRTSSAPPESPVSMEITPYCVGIRIHEHTYGKAESEVYCSVCERKEVAFQCTSCTMSLCWGCYGTNVIRYI
jgi:hypothetical protein